MRTLDLGTQHVGNHPHPVELPLDFITESSAILAKKGAGKTNALIVLLEEAWAVGVPVVSIDPKGDHWGLRAGSDAHPHAGLSIPVFGGLHGDVPLEPTAAAGAYIANLLRDRALSAVLDVSEFTIGERARFLTAFADRLYRFDSHEPMLLGLEEAHEYIPQMVRGEEARMVSAFERLVKLGRSKGLGVVMVTQRSASLNKNVLTQVDNLFVMRTTSPQDRTAVTAWLDTNADRGVLDGLGGLKTGETVLVQPARGEPVQFRFRMRRTYDAGETPKVGEKRREPATLADVDLSEISAAMAETIEKAKADDPKLLRASIADLQKQLAARPVEEVVREVEKVVEVPMLSDADGVLLAEIDGMLKGLAHSLPEYRALREKIAASVPNPRSEPKPVRARELVPHESAPTTPRPAPTAGEARGSDSDRVRLGKAERAILAALATHGGMPHKRLALIAGYSPSSSGFKNPLASLRRAEYAVGGGDHIEVTPAGVEALGDFEPLPTGEALIEYWMDHPQSGKAERAILGALIDAWPSPLTHNELAARAGYEPTSSGFKNPLAKLRRLELAHGGGTAIYASDELGEARNERKAS